MFKVKNYCRRSSVFIINFEDILHLLLFLLFTLSKYLLAGNHKLKIMDQP